MYMYMYIQSMLWTDVHVHTEHGMNRCTCTYRAWYEQMYMYIQSMVWTDVHVHTEHGMNRCTCTYRAWYEQMYMYIQSMIWADVHASGACLSFFSSQVIMYIYIHHDPHVHTEYDMNRCTCTYRAWYEQMYMYIYIHHDTCTCTYRVWYDQLYMVADCYFSKPLWLIVLLFFLSQH